VLFGSTVPVASRLVEHTSAAMVAGLLYLGAALGAIAAWTVLGDSMSAPQLAGLGLALIGAALVVGSDHEHPHSHDPIEHSHEHDHDLHHQHSHPHTPAGPHTHLHRHQPLVHAHPHVPDLHHRHVHDD
jgi:hypothetical protein